MAVLEFRAVNKAFGGTAVLSDINFQVNEGEIVSLLGPSGCGKSTLLRMVAGLDTRYSGHVLLDGAPIQGPSTQVGVVFQEARLFPWLSVRKNIAFGLKEPGEDRVIQLAHQVGLGDFLDCLPRQLSGGMAQRCAIARALVTRPRILLMDEPFSALDAFTRMHLQDITLSLWRQAGTTLLLVTHDIDEALYLSDRIIVMSERPGRIKAEVTIDQPRPRPRSSAAMHPLKDRILHLLEFGGRRLSPPFTASRATVAS